METINYLGKYDSLDALWAAYPTGGIEGDYVRIADEYYGWDKYINNWVKTELTVEEEPEDSEPVRTDALSAVNYLGEYESMSAVWKKIPEGGHEGDYLSINGACYLWDSSKRNWVIDETEEVTPPEGAGSQTGSTNTQLNFLGKFASIADAWYFYPEGGHLGDFLLSKDIYYIWDAATTNWIDSTDSEYVDYDFSGEAEKAIETRTTINYLGSFEELNDVWIIYPEGGHEGDYIHLKEVITIWNKYRRQWGEDSSPATPAIKTDKIDGSLTINHDLTVSGIAYLPSIVTDITKLGLFGLSLYLNGSLVGKYNPAQEDTEFYLDGIATKDELGSEVNKINLTIQQTDSELRTLISSISGSSHNHSNLSVLNKITDAKLTNWDTAFSWGNHANAGYLKSISSEQIVAAIPAIYLGKTQVQYEAKAQDLTGISSLMLEKSTSKLAYDSANDAWKLTGNLLVTGFITAGAKGHSGSGEGGESYTQYEWSEIKSMTETGMGLLASAFSVKEAYDDVSTSVNSINSTVANIRSLIPNAATSSNQLADKNFVNSSIASNTAVFRGTFETLSDLPTQNVKTNDYAFVIISVNGNPEYQRYKFNGTSWVFEYTLNNSSFTAEQWSAINSGITTTKVGNYDNHLIDYGNPHKVTKSQVGLGLVENVAISTWKGSENITTLGTITKGTWKGTKIGNDYLANSSITIGTTSISLGSTVTELAGITKLQLNDANSNLAYDSTTGSWKLTGNLLVTGFISAGAKGNSSSGGGSTYTQREWAEIKIMSASEIGLLASAYSVKEAYNELNTAIETLAGKATNVTFSQTLTSGKQIGSISIDGKSTSLFAPANYAWSEVTGKPAFATVATSGSYADLSNKPTIASLMGSAVIGGTSSFIYWNGSAFVSKALGTNAFTSISKVSQLTNDSGYITGITKSMVEAVLTGDITSHTHSQYLTAHQPIYALTIQKNGTTAGTYTPNSQAATINISDVASAATLSAHTTNTTVHITANERTLWNKITGLFDVDADGDIYVKNGKGFYTEGFISAGAKGTSGGGSSTYTQKEWAQIKDMTATASGSLASAYAVKEAYSEAKTLIDVNTGNITSLTSRVTTLEGKATAVSFSQTLTSGTKIGAITVDGTTTNIYAPTLASQMGSTAIGGTSSYLYWNGSAWATKALGTAAFASSSDFAAASHTHSNYVDLTSQQTITGNKIFSGAIQVGAIGINTDNVGLYGYGEDAVEIYAENTLTLCGERNTYIGNADNSAMVDIQEDMAGYNAETGVETWYIYREGYAEFQSISGALANSLAIKLNGGTTEGTNLFTFNNSASKTINITPSAIGAAAASHTHSYLPLAGGTLTGDLYINTTLYGPSVGSNPRNRYDSGLYFFNCSGATTSAYNFGLYQWADEFQFTYRTSSNNSYKGNAFTIQGSDGQVAFTKTPKVGSTPVSLEGHTHSYLPLSGGTMANTNVVTNLNADLLDGYQASQVLTSGMSPTIDLNEISVPSIYRLSTENPNLPSPIFNYGNLLTVRYVNSDTAWQLLGAYSSDNLWFRRGSWKADGTGTLRTNAWKAIAFTDSNVASASKWATPRTITLTGSVTGSVSIDGSQNVSLATTTNHTHNYLPLSGGTLSGHLIMASARIKMNGGIFEFNDSSGSTQKMLWAGMDPSTLSVWSNSNWYSILHSGNYNSYAPKLDGTGASGTWGISISGNAATATNADTLDGFHISSIVHLQDVADADTMINSIVQYLSVDVNAYHVPFGGGELLSFGNEWYSAQLYISHFSNRVAIRGMNYGTWNNWHELAFLDSNVASATKLANSRTIWGQSFDGTGNVSGALTGVTTITTSGQICINTSSSQANNYNEGIRCNLGGSSNWASVVLGGASGSTSSTGPGVYALLVNSGLFRIRQYNTEVLCINTSNNVGIGTTSPSYKLHIVGVAYASEGLVSDGYISAASTSTSSDIRLKDNISDISSEMALKWLSMLKPKSWSWNDKAGVTGQSMGFVAQDVEGILPQMIRKRRDNDYLSLDYTQLHAIEVSALQSHEKRIEELERENKILKEELNKLKLYAN